MECPPIYYIKFTIVKTTYQITIDRHIESIENHIKFAGHNKRLASCYMIKPYALHIGKHQLALLIMDISSHIKSIVLKQIH